MALSAVGRKNLLEHGLQREIADAVHVAQGYVSQVVNGVGFPLTRKGWKKYRKVQRAVARRLGMAWEDAFSDKERGVRQDRSQQSAEQDAA